MKTFQSFNSLRSSASPRCKKISFSCAVPLLALLLSGCGPAPDQPADGGSLAVSEALGGDIEGYARATEPREFKFPADHGPHPEFRTEWWYFTGNLADRRGERYGFQLTLFRNALAPEPLEGPSRWRKRQVYMAHLALTDVAGGRFVAEERFARAALGLAGARAAPFRVWLEDWEVSGGEGRHPFPVTLRAGNDKDGIELTLGMEKTPILQGEAGLSQKSEEPGNASYYYSYSRLSASGRITIDGVQRQVDGSAWMDREWSTSALGPEQSGWDWFALQLDNNVDLMLYRLRRRDGSTDPASAGSLVSPEGERTALREEDFEVTVTRHWESPRGGRYPAGWRLQLPQQQLWLRVEPLLADQELDLSVRYWEGAVRISGEHRGQPVAGYGYVELTGYAE
ncbi:Predicted secreted hydrolase [Thiohalomonas denitrificans]|uniref:Predicted secreted hydrolase n=1 Tax=Thiohalomonas denitrificans TaxID=415747 RepID=A0A1G5PLD8_9GAMM|nr:Predicted secreted hydrolase [Thiohalomonas denitrificans]